MAGMNCKRMAHPEQELQKAVARFLDAALMPGVFWCHVPNGGKRVQKKNAQGKWFSPEAKRLKAMGVKAGVPDIMLLNGGLLYWIELKAGKSKLSDAQSETHLRLLAAGSRSIAVCYSLEEVQDFMLRWQIPLRGALT